MSGEVDVHLLDDTPAQEDAFGGHKHIARAISTLVVSEQGGKAIAIEGSWGSGKSSIIRMLQKELGVTRSPAAVAPPGAKVSVFVFDAWSHEGDHLRRAFLEELTTHCTQHLEETDRDHWATRRDREVTGRVITREEKRTPKLRSARSLLIMAGAALYPLALVVLTVLLRHPVPQHYSWWVGLILSILIAVAPTIAILCLYLYVKRHRIRKRALLRAGRVLSLLHNKISEDIITTGHEGIGPTSIQFQSYFSDLLATCLNSPEHRLVIVLDNLDRVDGDTALTLWSTLQLFADCCTRREQWSERVWFIVPYDQDAAVRLFAHKEHKSSSAFLDKTFVVRFPVPPIHLVDWESYLKRLLHEAMPGMGTPEELHRVYRLSERFSDERGHAPSPRHLKLFVNDIGAIVRQFGTHFPLDHVALYCLLRRRGKDVKAWITTAEFDKDPFDRVMGSRDYIMSLSGIYFGTASAERAQTLTIASPLRTALLKGESQSLVQLVKVPGFWNVAENELQKTLSDDDLTHDKVCALASALHESRICGASPTERRNVVPAFATYVLEHAIWEHLDKDSAVAASRLMRIASRRSATEAVFTRLVSSAKRPDAVIKSQDWSDGIRELVTASRELGHRFEINIVGDVDSTIGCLAGLLDIALDSQEWERVGYQVETADLLEALRPSAETPWRNQCASAVKALVNISRSTSMLTAFPEAILQRLLAENIAEDEAENLLDTLFLLSPATAPQFRQFVRSPHFYRDYLRWQRSSRLVALLVASQLLSGKLLVAGGSEEQAGHAQLTDVLTGLDAVEAVAAFISIASEHSKLPLVDHCLRHAEAIPGFARLLVRALIENSATLPPISAEAYIEASPRLASILDEEHAQFAVRLLSDRSFCKALATVSVSQGNEIAHGSLLAHVDSSGMYAQNIHTFLRQLTDEEWDAAFAETSDLTALLRVACERGLPVPDKAANAMERMAVSLGKDEIEQLDDTLLSTRYLPIYLAIARERRRTLCNRVVDELRYRNPSPFHQLTYLLGGDLRLAFSQSTARHLVRQVADPIVNTDDEVSLRWLAETVSDGNAFWNAAQQEDAQTFSSSLSEQLESAPASSRAESLRQIATTLSIDI